MIGNPMREIMIFASLIISGEMRTFLLVCLSASGMSPSSIAFSDLAAAWDFFYSLLLI
jgi:hypothetical protein